MEDRRHSITFQKRTTGSGGGLAKGNGLQEPTRDLDKGIENCVPGSLGVGGDHKNVLCFRENLPTRWANHLYGRRRPKKKKKKKTKTTR